MKLDEEFYTHQKFFIFCTKRDATPFLDAIVFMLLIGSLINLQEDSLQFPLSWNED